MSPLTAHIRLPRYGLRTLFVVVTVAAVAIWLGSELKNIRDRGQFLTRAASYGDGNATIIPVPELPAYRRWLGDKLVRRINVNSDDDKRIGQRLFPEAWVVHFPADFKLTNESVPDPRKNH